MILLFIFLSISSNVSAQIMQLSERASELAQENDQLLEQNQEKSRQIDLVESEHKQLIKQSAHRYINNAYSVFFWIVESIFFLVSV